MSRPTDETRRLIVTADDFGIGPATSRGILDLAAFGAVTTTVLLVNSPFAEDAVAEWFRAGRVPELGWHPCLTLDRPILPPGRVPSLVDADGRFFPLGKFMAQLYLRRIVREEIEAELAAQLERFQELTGQHPATVNGHHHVHVFGPVGNALRQVLRRAGIRPYLRRVVEPFRTLIRVPGARVKRGLLCALGRRAALVQVDDGFPGAEALAGVTDPLHVFDRRFFRRWLERIPCRVVELACHPGYLDEALIGRDGTLEDGLLRRRVEEFKLLADGGFLGAARAAGFKLSTAAGAFAEPESSHV